MTHELPQRQGGPSAALHTTKPSLVPSSTATDSVSLRIRRRCLRLKPLDIPTATTDDSKDALSFRWWAVQPPTAAADKQPRTTTADSAVVSITIVAPSLASLAASLASLDCSLAAGLSVRRDAQVDSPVSSLF